MSQYSIEQFSKITGLNKILIRTWENKEIYNGGRIIACNNKKILRESRSILIKKKPSQR